MTNGFRRSGRDLLIAAAAVVVLTTCAVVVHPDRVSGAEEALFRLVNGLPALLYRPVWLVMQLGNLLALPVLAVAALALRRWRLGATLLVATPAKMLFGRVVKDTVTRHRPASVIDDVVLRGDASAVGEAFVSGHAVVAFAIAVLVHPYVAERRRWLVWALALSVCLGRVYVGAHLPLDVVGGAALGAAIGWCLRFASGIPRPDQSASSPGSDRPPGA